MKKKRVSVHLPLSEVPLESPLIPVLDVDDEIYDLYSGLNDVAGAVDQNASQLDVRLESK